MTYEELIEYLKRFADGTFAAGQSHIVNDPSLKFIGVKTPVLRKTAKSLKTSESIFSFPDDYYEVVFIKLAIASEYDYNKFTSVVESLLPLITNWALCDSALKPICIAKHKEQFVPYIQKFILSANEFTQRFALVMLLSFYVEEEWLDLIKECVEKCDSSKYYVMMGAAWLVSEVLVKHYEYGLFILKSTMCNINIKNKAISKACDSYRITKEQKTYLKTLRTKFVVKNVKSID